MRNKTMILLAVILFSVLSVTAEATVFQQMSYQGILTDDAGNRIEGSKTICFSIYNTSSGGSALWGEECHSMDIQQGIVNVVLGSDTAINLDGTQQYWLGIRISGESEMTPRIKLTAVPYSMNADHLDGNDASYFAPASHDHDDQYVNESQPNSITSGMIVDLSVGSSDLANNSVTSGKIQDGTIQQCDMAFTAGDITAVNAGNGLTGGGDSGPVTVNVGSGTGISVSSDAVALASNYADGSAHDGRFVLESGDTMTGTLFLQRPSDAANTVFKTSTGTTRGWIKADESYNLLEYHAHGALSKFTTTTSQIAWFVDDNEKTILQVNEDGIHVDGDITKTGTVSFVEPHPTDNSKEIVYVCLEGGEAGTYCAGSANLVDGFASIVLPDHFTLVTSRDGIIVQLTPRGDRNGLFFSEVSPDRLVVRELGGGTTNVKFDYFVKGIRKGYEDYLPIREKQLKRESN